MLYNPNFNCTEFGTFRYIDSWEENGASERALRLRDALMEQVEMLLIAIPQKDIGAEEC